ncbi:hypothetical protein [Acrocarpospora sp. B8E8]|uniref:hypothetical protein n=1 Tax=Acrocarpospora sp. B8E8 TaxID=3153572 RepID=UPI00325E2268
MLAKRLVNMPGESALAAAVRGGSADWGNAEHLLAAVIDRLNITNWLMVEIHKAEGKDNPLPAPFPRPSMTPAQRPEDSPEPVKFASPKEVMAVFAGLKVGRMI